MNQFERRWFRFMLDRPVRKVVFLIPYWLIRTPVLLLASVLQHADKKRADRLMDVSKTHRKQ